MLQLRMKYFDFKHLRSVKESYFEHMTTAVRYSFLFFTCALFCLFHAFFPFFLVSYASDRAREIVSCSDSRKEEVENEKS